jgi:hypothetical protein
MQALGHSDRQTRLRAAAALLTCVLVLTFLAAAQRSHTHKHAARAAVVLSISTGDTLHLTPRTDHHPALGATPSTLAALIAWPATADSSTVASSHTASSPSVRGPPAEALA